MNMKVVIIRPTINALGLEIFDLLNVVSMFLNWYLFVGIDYLVIPMLVCDFAIWALDNLAVFIAGFSTDPQAAIKKTMDNPAMATHTTLFIFPLFTSISIVFNSKSLPRRSDQRNGCLEKEYFFNKKSNY